MAINKVVYENTVLIDLTADTVTEDNLLAGAFATDRSGTRIKGKCTYDADTSDANVSASEILAGKKVYAQGNPITGTMPSVTDNTKVISDITDSDNYPVTIKSGYHDGSETVSVDSSAIVAGNIKSGVSILGIAGSYTGEGVPTQSKTATPKTTAQTILPDEGYNLSQVIVNAIPRVDTPNSYGTTVEIAKP